MYITYNCRNIASQFTNVSIIENDVTLFAYRALVDNASHIHNSIHFAITLRIFFRGRVIENQSIN